jgi:hypothetical protein
MKRQQYNHYPGEPKYKVTPVWAYEIDTPYGRKWVEVLAPIGGQKPDDCYRIVRKPVRAGGAQ